MRAGARRAAVNSKRSTPRDKSTLLFIIAFLATTIPLAAKAILTTDQGAPAIRITSTGGLSSEELSAYNLEGKFRSFIGTPIAQHHFITARHIGIALSDTISFDQGPNAGSYGIVGWYDDAETDLRIVEIDGAFAAWAPLWGSPDEGAQQTTLFGRGGLPNGAVSIDPELKGWRSGPADGQISWGRNLITGTYGANLIYANFDKVGLPTEAGLSVGDSGGGWFITDPMGTVRLAGVSFATTGPFQFDVGGAPDGSPFEAVLFDLGGLWVGRPGSETFIAENPINTPGLAIGTRISARIAWINTIISATDVDTDMDGVLDEFDNCVFTANPSQSDSGGIGTATPDGIGDACQCGDVTAEGEVNAFDAEWIKREALSLPAPLFLVPGNCDVTGEGLCNGMDALLVRHAAAGTISPFFGQNCPNATP
jgi:hypothetical protein